MIKEIENIVSRVSIRYSNTRERLAELEIAWKHLPCGLVFPLQFLVLPNFHLCFYNCMETRKMFLFFLFLNCNISQRITNKACTLVRACHVQTIVFAGLTIRHNRMRFSRVTISKRENSGNRSFAIGHKNCDPMPSLVDFQNKNCQRFAPDRVFGILRKMRPSRERKIQKKGKPKHTKQINQDGAR